MKLTKLAVAPLLLFACLAAGPRLGAAEQWTKVSTPQFTILTADSVGEAKAWAVAIEAFRRDLQGIVGGDDRTLDPLTVLVFKDGRSFKALMAPRPKGAPPGEPLSRSSAQNGRSLVAVNPSEPEVARKAVLMHSTHWLIGSSRWPLPLWLFTGLQELYANYARDGDRIVIGGAFNSSARAQGKLALPLAELMAMDADSSYYKSDNLPRFIWESWAFVHFLMLGEKGENRAAFLNYMGQLQRGVPSAEAFAAAFPGGLGELGSRFDRFARSGIYRTQTLPHHLGEIEKNVTVSRASEADVQIGIGYFQLAERGADQASVYFARAVALAPDEAGTLEAQADLAMARGDQDTANGYYERAAQAGSHFYLAHFYPKLNWVRTMIGGEAAADRYDETVVRQTVDSLKETIRLRPSFFKAHEAFAGLIGSLRGVNTDDGAVLAEGMRRFPDQGMIQAGQVAYEIATGHLVSAKKRIDRIAGGNFAGDSQVTHYTKKLDRRLQALVSLGWAEKFYAEGKYDQAGELVESLRTAPLLPEEFQRCRKLTMNLSTWSNLALAAAAVERKDWAEAESLLAAVASVELSEAMKAEHTRLEARVAEGRRPAGQ
jgi:tetratricopeptide (TPR) repeat protein